MHDAFTLRYTQRQDNEEKTMSQEKEKNCTSGEVHWFRPVQHLFREKDENLNTMERQAKWMCQGLVDAMSSRLRMGEKDYPAKYLQVDLQTHDPDGKIPDEYVGDIVRFAMEKAREKNARIGERAKAIIAAVGDLS